MFTFANVFNHLSKQKIVGRGAALGVRVDGAKEILGLWIEHTEGAKFWLRVMTELKNLGVNDVLIAVVSDTLGLRADESPDR